jgi:hypothetical protein
VEGFFTSSCPVRVAGPVVACAFDEPMALKTGLRLGASEAEAAVEVERLMRWISLLASEDLDLREPPVSLVSCFISLRRCESSQLAWAVVGCVGVLRVKKGEPCGGSGRMKIRGLGIRSCARSLCRTFRL